ncbi:MAG TPA: cyanophycin synthetase, partial [bacterium]|nr:cyanophycin synthetase [bacterium]
VGLEHQNILGKTISKITREKAGILKEGCLAAAVQPHPEAARVINEVAREKGSLLWLAGRDFWFKKTRGGFDWEGPGLSGEFKLPGFPDYQISNAALALAGIQLLKDWGVKGDKRLIRRSFSNMRWPGRVEAISRKPSILLDGAHNPEAAKALCGSLKACYPKTRWIVLNGFLEDKDHTEVIRLLKPLALYSIVAEPDSDRKKDGKKVFEAWEREGVPSLLIKNGQKALEMALAKLRRCPPETGLLITGSFYLVGACRKQLAGLKGLDRI